MPSITRRTVRTAISRIPAGRPSARTTRGASSASCRRSGRRRTRRRSSSRAPSRGSLRRARRGSRCCRPKCVGGEQDHDAAGDDDREVHKSRQHAAVVELGTGECGCGCLCGGVHHEPASARTARKLRLQCMIPPVERVAVIDMGSNSWRLVVFGYEPGTPWWSLVDEIREAVRIGAGMGDEATSCSPSAWTARSIPPRCSRRSAARPACEEVEAVATSAIRDAANGAELLADIERTTGLEARVISGRRGGPLRLARDRELDDDRGRLRARHRRRQHPDAAARGPAAGRRATRCRSAPCV